MSTRPTVWTFLREQGAFRRLWLATGVAELGTSIARIAFILLVHQRAVAAGSASPEAANALMLVLETAPIVLLGPIAGALVDRCDRRTLLVVCNVLQAVLMLSVPFLMRLAVDWPLYAVAMCVAAISTVFPPARQSAIPDLVGVERSSTANSISGSTTSLTFVIGMGCASLLIERFGKEMCFYVNGGCFLFAARHLVSLNLPRHFAPVGGGISRFARDVVAGARYAWSRPTLAYITACFFMAFVFIGIWMPLMPEYLRRDLGVDADFWMPYAMMSFGIGGICGGALGAWLGRKFGMGRMIVLIYLIEPFQVMAYFWVNSVALMIALSFTWGVLAFAYFVQEQTVMHEDVPAELRGRVFGLLPPLQAFGTLVASVIVLVEAGALRPRTMLLLAGASYLLTSLVFTLSMRGSRELWSRKPRDAASTTG
ncbi:MAG: MFS transporter [Planctomycetes bacterium]|nr:MFS transporter [Planctomycetota bacterium]